MRAPIALTPDLLGHWRTKLLAALAEAEVVADVGPKRPHDVTNLDRRFVRIMCAGGPWRFRNLWYPRLIAESWAQTVAEARRLDAIVSRATRLLEGDRTIPTSTSPGMFISSCELDVSGADQSLDGAPFVLTTTSPLCVQVTPAS